MRVCATVTEKATSPFKAFGEKKGEAGKGKIVNVQKYDNYEISYDNLVGKTFLSKKPKIYDNAINNYELKNFKQEVLFFNLKKEQYEKPMTVLSAPLRDIDDNVYGVAIMFNRL